VARAVKLNISLEGALNKAVEKSKFRVFLILPIIILTFLAIAIKTTILCTQNISERLLSDNVSQVPNILHQVSLAPSKAIRKNIYDRNGILIS